MNELDRTLVERTQEYIRNNIPWLADTIAKTISKNVRYLKFIVVNDGFIPDIVTVDTQSMDIELSYEVWINDDETEKRTQYIGNFYKYF
jgi:hypothetical protein